MKVFLQSQFGAMPCLLIMISFCVYSLFFPCVFRCTLTPCFCHALAAVGWLSMFQATAPVNIPVVSELAGLGNTNGTGPLTGTGNGISVSWQSPPVIFKGVSVSEALSHAFSSSPQPLLPLLLLHLPVFYCPRFFIQSSFYIILHQCVKTSTNISKQAVHLHIQHGICCICMVFTALLLFV